METITRLKEILANEGLRFQIIKNELIEVKEKYGDERKTEIIYLANDISIEDLIEEEDVVVTISHLGYIKRTSAREYRQQKRGGRGARGAQIRDEDYIEQIFSTSTHDTLLFFTQMGKCYWLKVYEIADGDKVSKGRAIQNLISIAQDDKVRTVIAVRDLGDQEYIENHFITLCTRKGIIKKTKLADFSRPRQNGINAITINEGDQLLDACLTDGKHEIMMAVKSGRAIRFPEEKVRPTGRGAIGVFGISVDSKNDEVIGMICVHSDDPDHSVLVISAKGFGKRTKISEYRITNRGGKGVKTINITPKTGELIGLLSVNEKQDLMIICKSGVTIRTSVTSVREAGRATQGVKVIRVDDGDEIAAITKIDETEEDEINVEINNGTEGDATTPNNLTSDNNEGESENNDENLEN